MYKYFFAFISIFILVLIPSVAGAEEFVEEQGFIPAIFSGNGELFGRVAYAWTSFIAAIIIFVLVFKFMAGGQLARPITIIGFGSLANALIGFIPIVSEVYLERFISPTVEVQLLWFGSLVFHISVIIGVFGIAKVFGLLRVK